MDNELENIARAWRLVVAALLRLERDSREDGRALSDREAVEEVFSR